MESGLIGNCSFFFAKAHAVLLTKRHHRNIYSNKWTILILQLLKSVRFCSRGIIRHLKNFHYPCMTLCSFTVHCEISFSLYPFIFLCTLTNFQKLYIFIFRRKHFQETSTSTCIPCFDRSQSDCFFL